ncbi:hypothetical protein JCM5296_006637 [Sporobolomyces johnsonii]
MEDDDLISLHGISSRQSDSGYASTARGSRKRPRGRSSSFSLDSTTIDTSSSRSLNARMDALTKQMEVVSKATEGRNRANAGTSLGIVRKTIVRRPQRNELGGIEGHAARRNDSVGADEQQDERPVLKRRRTLTLRPQPSQQRSKSYEAQLNQPEDEDDASPLQLVRVLSPSGSGAMRTKVMPKRTPTNHGGSQMAPPMELPFWMRGEHPTVHRPCSPSPTPPWLAKYLARPASYPALSARPSSTVADPAAFSLEDSGSPRPAISSSSTVQLFPDTFYDPPPSPFGAASALSFQPIPSAASAAPLPFSTSGRAVSHTAPPPERTTHLPKSLYELQMTRQRYAVQLSSSPLLEADPAPVFAAPDRCPPSRVDSTYNPASPLLKGKQRYAETLRQEAAHFFDSKSPSPPPAAKPAHDVFGPTLSLPSAALAAAKRATPVEHPLQPVESPTPYRDENLPPPSWSSVPGFSPLHRPQSGPLTAATRPPRHDLDRKVLLQTPPPPPANHPPPHAANADHKVLVPSSPSPPPFQPHARHSGRKRVSSPSPEKPALPEGGGKVDAGSEARPGNGWDFVARAGQLASFLVVQAAQEMESRGEEDKAQQGFEIFKDEAAEEEEEDPIEEA